MSNSLLSIQKEANNLHSKKSEVPLFSLWCMPVENKKILIGLTVLCFIIYLSSMSFWQPCFCKVAVIGLFDTDFG